MVRGKDKTRDPDSTPGEEQESRKGGRPPDVTAPKGVGTAAGAVADPEIARGEPRLPERRLRNAGTKLIWLPLNSGEHKAIPAGAECKVLARDLQGNAAFEKLKRRHWIIDPDEARPKSS